MRSHGPRYQDPLDQIWTTTAQRIGFSIRRTGDAYASTDGGRTIAVGTPDLLDGDDCLAQMILHELCHALVEGEGAWAKADWGLDNQTVRDEPREEACLRTQAALTRTYGLGEVLAPTTDHRPIYDGLGPDVIDRPEVRQALARAERKPFAPHLHEALAATAEVLRAARAFGAGSLGDLVTEPTPHHPSGFLAAAPGSRAAAETCEGCAWWSAGRCRAAKKRVKGPACERWEPAPDCQDCGACCREAYGEVHVGPRDPFVKRHPELVVRHWGLVVLPRVDGRCVALQGVERMACSVYEDRPRTCRDFARQGEHCLTARRRVGLTR